jgi:ribonucleoside-triphosphate reductase
VNIEVVCDPSHADYEELVSKGLVARGKEINALHGRGNAVFTVQDSREGWALVLTDVLDHAWDIGFGLGDFTKAYIDVSEVRPKGAELKRFGGTASGPVPLAQMLIEVSEVVNSLHQRWASLSPLDAMTIDHAIAKCVVAGGVRRSARMSILPWDDPDIFEFIDCKSDFESHWSTNISVAVDNRFYVEASESGTHANRVLKAIASGMLANGEPGIWNQEYSQQGEHGRVDSTNPCGEIPLEDWEACNLGHINLEYFAPHEVNEKFDLEGAKNAARLMTRFLIRATFGDITDKKSREIMDRNRRIGVGITGYQSALALMGINYSWSWSSSEVEHILKSLKKTVDDEAMRYAKELRIPAPIKTTTVAPTGTVSKLAGVTEGIHPVYARYFKRRIRFSDIRPEEVTMVDQYRAEGFQAEPDMYSENTTVVTIPTKETLVEEVERLGFSEDIIESADEIPLYRLLAVQADVQSLWADNAVSFTANIAPEDYTPETLAEILLDYGPLTKGTTIMPRNDSRPQSPYEAISKAAYEEATAKTVADSVDEECATGACPIR